MGRPEWSRRDHVVAGLAVAVFAGLVFAYLGADPPTVRPWGVRILELQEFLVEGPAKAHEARNWALFGEWQRSPVDNYQFWRAQSPVWVYPLALAFRLFGTTYATLQAFGGAIAVVGVIGLWRLLRERVPGPVGVAALWVYATAVFPTLIARSGLTEGPLNAAAVWLVLTLVKGKDHPSWLVGSQVVFTLAFFVKQGFVFLFPLMVIANVAAFVGWWADGRFPRARWAPVVSAAVGAAIAAALILQPAYLRAVGWNVAHMVTGGVEGDTSSFIPVPWTERASPDRIWRASWLLLPIVGPLALPALTHVGWRAVRDRDWAMALVAGWGASGWAAVLGMRAWSVRHGSILMLPTLVAVAIAAVAFLRPGRWSRARWAIAAGIVVASLVQGSYEQVRRLRAISYTFDDFVAAAEATVNTDHPVAIGRFAVPMLFASTRFDTFYVKEGFNTRRDQILGLAPTHFLMAEPVDQVEFDLSKVELEDLVGCDCPVTRRMYRTIRVRLCFRDEADFEQAVDAQPDTFPDAVLPDAEVCVATR